MIIVRIDDVLSFVREFEGWLEGLGVRRRRADHFGAGDFSVAVFDDQTPEEERLQKSLGLACAYIAITPALSGHGSEQSPVAVLFPVDVIHVVADERQSMFTDRKTSVQGPSAVFE